MIDDDSLRGLEGRIEALEEKLLTKDGNSKMMMKILNGVDETLTAFATKRDRFKQIFDRVPAIVEYMSPGYVDTVCMAKAYEEEVVMSREQDMREMCEQLEQVDHLSKAIDHDKLLQLPLHKDRVCKLEIGQLKNLDEFSALSEDVRNLMVVYNELINGLSESFTTWDHTISKLEEEAANRVDV